MADRDGTLETPAPLPHSDDELVRAALDQEFGPRGPDGALPGAPDHIGPYRIVRQIGVGGMGEVYEAHQVEELTRRVAVKVIKLGMDTREVVARFQRERETLAQMGHSNIAKVYDAGATERGQPYFAMEYVDGEAITTFCDRHHLTIPERLGLFTDVCHGVQHAHQKGVIHRDLKPSNVLVASEGSRAVPKIIDFGIAKAITDGVRHRTTLTRFEQQIGTREYMSPEQALGGEVDTRSDVYSLGVILYELLVGVLPSDSIGPGRLAPPRDDPRQRIDARRPSTRLSGVELDVSKLSVSRKTDIAALKRLLKRDLDWIVMKAIDADSARRYAGAAELAAEIERYRAGEPVTARPPSARYRFSKFVRRNRSLVILTLTVFLLLLAGVATSTMLAISAQTAERKTRWQAYLANISAAHGALTVNDTASAQRRLDAAPEEFRSWEWRYLNAASDNSVYAVPSYDDRPTFMFHVADTDCHVSISPYGPIRLWDGSDPPVEIQHGYRFANTRNSVSANIDGSLIAAITEQDGATTIRFWDGRTLEEQVPLRVDDRPASCLALSPNGTLLALGFEGGSVELWNRKTGTRVETLGHHVCSCFAMAFSEDGTHLASSGLNDMSICVWSLGTEGDPSSRLESIFSRSRKPDVCVPEAGKRSQESIRSFEGHSGFVAALAFSPDGTRLASASQDNTIRVWDLDGQRGNLVLSGHLDDVSSVEFSRDGAHLASGSCDGTIRVWDSNQGREIAVLRGHKKRVWSVTYTQGGFELASLSQDGTLRRWGGLNLRGTDLSPGALYGDQVVIEHHRQSVSTIAFSLDGTLMASGSCENQVAIWDVGTWTLRATVPTINPDTRDVAFSPDGGTLAVAGADARIHLWDWEGGRKTETLVGHTGIVLSADYNRTGTRLVSGSYDSTVRVWDPSTGELLDTLDGHENEPVLFVAFSEDGGYIISYSDADPGSGGSEDSDVGLICVWEAGEIHEQLWCGRVPRQDAETGVGPRDAIAALPTYLRHVQPCRALALAECLFSEEPSWNHLAISPDGSRVAVALYRGIISILNAETGEEMLRLRAHDGEHVRCVAFSPDGTLLASGSHDQNVYLWDTIPNALRHEQRDGIRDPSKGVVPAADFWR